MPDSHVLTTAIASPSANLGTSDVGVGAGVNVGAATGPHATTLSVISPNIAKAVRMTTAIIAF